MNFNTLKSFQTVAQQNNLTNAAAKLNISQPALSRTIKWLENEIGFSLFDHSRNRIFLNSNGKKFLAMVNSIMSQYESCIRDIQEDNGIYSTKLTIAFSSGGRHLPGIIHDFKKQYPSTKFVLKSYHHDTIDSDTNFCFMSTYQKHVEQPGICLCEEPLFLTVSPNSPLSKKKAINLSELSTTENFLFPDYDNDLYAIQMHFCNAVGFTPITPNIAEKQNILTLLLELGEGISLLPKLNNPNLVQIPVMDIHCSRFIYLIKNNSIFETQLAHEFEKFCYKYMSKIGF